MGTGENGKAAPKRGQNREPAAPARVSIVESPKAAVVELPPPDPMAVLAADVAIGPAARRAELIDRATDAQLDALWARLGADEGRGEVQDEIARRRRVAAAEAKVRSEEERAAGLVSVGKRYLPCPMPADRLIEVRAQYSKESWALHEAEEAEKRRAADAKAAIKDAKEALEFLARMAGTGLHDEEVQVEERLESDKDGKRVVVAYRLDTGEAYMRRGASDADIEAAAQVRLRWRGGGR